MPLKINCPKCEKAYKLSKSFSGKRVRCKECATVFKVANQSANPDPAPVAGTEIVEPPSEPPVIRIETAKPRPSPMISPRNSADPSTTSRPRNWHFFIFCGLVFLFILLFINATVFWIVLKPKSRAESSEHLRPAENSWSSPSEKLAENNRSATGTAGEETAVDLLLSSLKITASKIAVEAASNIDSNSIHPVDYSWDEMSFEFDIEKSSSLLHPFSGIVSFRDEMVVSEFFSEATMRVSAINTLGFVWDGKRWEFKSGYRHITKAESDISGDNKVYELIVKRLKGVEEWPPSDSTMVRHGKDVFRADLRQIQAELGAISRINRVVVETVQKSQEDLRRDLELVGERPTGSCRTCGNLVGQHSIKCPNCGANDPVR